MVNTTTPPPKGKGRPPGAANKANVNARSAIADFVEGNVERLNGWLDAIADGIPAEIEKNDEGEEKVTKWLHKPDPLSAYNALMSVVEYHIPKLARTELAGSKEDPITIQIVQYGSNPDSK